MIFYLLNGLPRSTASLALTEMHMSNYPWKLPLTHGAKKKTLCRLPVFSALLYRHEEAAACNTCLPNLSGPTQIWIDDNDLLHYTLKPRMIFAQQPRENNSQCQWRVMEL
jgi:hypothetical protein